MFRHTHRSLPSRPSPSLLPLHLIPHSHSSSPSHARASLSHCALRLRARPPSSSSSDNDQRLKLRHSKTMYRNQGSQFTPINGDKVVIPGLNLLAAAQAGESVQTTTTATETVSAHSHQTASASASTLHHSHQPSSQRAPAPGPPSSSAASKTIMKAPPAARSKPYQTPRQQARQQAQQQADSDRESRAQPSPASGGVPNATPEYFDRSFPRPMGLPASRRILVIMDLNGTLLYRPSKKRPFHFVERPHAKRFMQYCLDNFYVAVWSSARPRNVNNMVSQLLTPDQVQKCLVIWARDRFGLTDEDYDSRVQCYKRLSTIWDNASVQASHPDAIHGGRWDQTNTVLVDDSVEKGRSEPHNILVLPEFEGLDKETADVLPQVHDYLNKLCSQANISSYMRVNPFRLDDNYSLRNRQQ